MASNLHGGHLLVGLCFGQGSLLLAGRLFHFPLCHNDSISSRSEHVCFVAQ